ncbi:MAG: helicase-associated domain-containing protein [Bellilinea sp.]|jgi:hypothetical protein
MPDLSHTLQGHDLGFLRIVASLWGLEISARDARTTLPALTRAMRDSALLAEIVDSLPASARNALQSLIENHGRMSWSLFSRRFGDIRPMGAARRDRERPHLNPASPAEILWYRGLIGKAFFNLPPEPQEYAYIPDDLATLLNLPEQPQTEVLGQAAPPAAYAHALPASDGILDEACTFLAALRMGLDAACLATAVRLPARPLEVLLRAAGLIDDARSPDPQAVRDFLESPRPVALSHLVQTWLNSSEFNELRLLPDVICEGEWKNHPQAARASLLNSLQCIPADTWWSLSDFIAAVKAQAPDFQRSAGDYDSWFIRRAADGEYLRGFACWDEVEGALITFIIRGPMHWLGLIDLAAAQEDAPANAFRFSDKANALLTGQPLDDFIEENGLLQLSAEGVLRIERRAPRWLRYQLARFSHWLPATREEYLYQITPQSLTAAHKQGLRGAHLIGLLRRHASPPLPPMILQAIERWEQHGSQARLQNAVLLRVASPDLLAALRKTPAGRDILEDLSPTCALIRSGSKKRLLRELARLGVLGEDQTEGV